MASPAASPLAARPQGRGAKGHGPAVLFSTGALYGLPLACSLRLAAAAGCDGVELVLDPLTILSGPARVRRLAERAGLRIVAIHPSLFSLPGWSRQPDAFRRLGSYAAALGCPLVVVHPPRRADLPRREAEFETDIEVLKNAVAGKATVLLENVAVFDEGDRCHPYIQPVNVAALARRHGLGIAFDTTHAVSADLTLGEAYRSVAPLVRHVHLSDFRRPHPLLDRPSLDTYFKHHRLPGDGGAGLAPFLRILRGQGYSGAITLELSPVALRVWAPWRSTALLRSAVRYVRDAWEARSAEQPGVVVRRAAVEA